MENFKEYVKMFLELISRPLFEIGGNTITLFSLITAGIIFGGSLLFAKFVGQVVERRLRNLHLDRGVKGSIERFSRYLVIVVGSLISLDTVGVSLQSLTALGAILMVGIGFGLQNITQNFISGIIILIERPIKQGDILQ
ncbi:MAG: mechanosensitive ion channel, partial [Bdellovibrionales bacterium]|nr:mechanosensitive ion channel [Bdellovibrionales bacterium]